MSASTFLQLADAFESAIRAHFGDVVRRERVDLVWPESFRGGFQMQLMAGSVLWLVEYIECQVGIYADDRELFGAKVHSGFSGNMFSEENLERCLPRIVQSAAACQVGAGRD